MPKVSISYKGTTCIYGIKSPTGKIYIGQTWDLYHRYKSGVSKNQRLLYRSYQKYGESNHKLFIIVEFRGAFTQTDLDYWERYYIEVYKTEGYQLLNIREGGGNNGKHSQETKELIGIKSKQWMANNPEKAKSITLNAIKANTGSKRSAETRNKQSSSAKGKVWTDSHKLNISKAKKGKPSPFKGKTFAPIVIEQIKKNRKGKGGIAINQYSINGEFIKQWDTIKSAAEQLNLHPGTINGCVLLKPSYKSCGGFIWRYADYKGIIESVVHNQTYNHTKKPVIQYDLAGDIIKEYESVKEAARHASNETSIRYCCESKQKSAGGFTWRYK